MMQSKCKYNMAKPFAVIIIILLLTMCSTPAPASENDRTKERNIYTTNAS